MKKYFILVIALLLFSTFTLSAKSSDFVKINDGDINYFTHKDLISSDYVVGSDKIFYGSKNGNVKLKIYLSEKDAIGTKNFKIGVRSHGSLIKVTELTIDSKTKIIQNATYEQFFIYSGLITFGNGLEEIEIELEFDPLDVGVREEIDIVLMDQQGNIIAVYDPFISGFNFRQKLTIGTSSIGLSGDITNDHTILIRISPSNEYWANDSCGDGTGITFAQSDEETELDFDPEEFNLGDENYFIWLEETETFTSASDPENWFYYDGVCVDNSDGSGAYPSSYSAVFHLNENSAYQDATTNANNETGSSVTRNITCPISKCASFNGSNQYVDFGTTIGDVGTGEFTYMIWVNTTTTGVHQHLMGARNIPIDTAFVRIYINIVAGKTVFNFGSGESLFSTTSVANTGWRLITVTRRSAGATNIYLDNVSENSGTNTNTGTSNNNANFTIGASDDLDNDLTGTLDEAKVFDYGLSADEVKLLYNSEIDNLITFGAEESEPEILDFNITFNVFQGTGIDEHLTDLTIDFNVNFYDASGLTSPFTINDVNTGHYLVTISKTQWDSNTFVLIVDANATTTIYIDKFVYPTISQFLTAGATTTDSSVYQTINTHRFETNFGSSSGTDVSCTLWASSNNSSEKNVFWRIQTSENGIDWLTRKETQRTMKANTLASSIYISVPDYNISDGNHFFRLQHRRQTGTSFDLNTNNVVCENFISRDQNNFIIPDFHNAQTGLSTSSSVFEILASRVLTTSFFNGFLYFYGDLIYSQTIAKGTASALIGLLGIPDSNSSEFPRTTESGSTGIGGVTGLFLNLNALTSYTTEAYAKTTAGTSSFDTNFHLKNLNQRAGEFDVNKDLSGTTLTTTSYSQLISIPINVVESGDFKTLAVLPFSCSDVDCDLNILMQFADSNSISHRRTTNGLAGDIGVLITQFLFTNIDVGDTNLIIWAKTNTGTITLEGGSVSIIHANSTASEETNAPLIPQIIKPVNGSTVSGSIVDYNCTAFDPNGDTLIYDVNIVFKSSNALALNLESVGDGNGSFDSTALANGLYSIDCTATEVTGNAFMSIFDNADYNFTVNNIVVIPPPSAKSDSCEITPKVIRKDEIYYFNADVVDSNGFTENLNVQLSFFNQKYDIVVFSSKTMKQALKGNYVFSKDLFLENGLYSYLINVDANCSISFPLEITDSKEVASLGSRTAQPKPINTTLGFDIWGFIEERALIILVLLLILIIIGGFVYIKKRKK